MNQLATQNERLPMDSVGMSTGSTGAKIAPQNLGEVVKFAEVMCRADIALPKHLRGNAGACMAVALQALEWQMSPFAVASKSYAVNGAIAYEAQLIAAVVNTRSGIKGRLKYRFDGEGSAMTCTVTGTLDGEECAYTSPPIGSITTKNSPLWKTDPQQQLGYYSSRSWARRYCPEVILGVYDRDEAEEFRGPDRAKNITPVFDPLSDEPVAAQEAQGAIDHVSTADIAHEPFDASTGEILDTDTGSSTEPAADDLIASGSSAQDGEVANPASPPSSAIPADVLTHFKDFARKASKTVTDESLSDDAKATTIKSMVLNYQEVLPQDQWQRLGSITKALQAVFAGMRTIDQARGFIGEVLGCDVTEIGG